MSLTHNGTIAFTNACSRQLHACLYHWEHERVGIAVIKSCWSSLKLYKHCAHLQWLHPADQLQSCISMAYINEQQTRCIQTWLHHAVPALTHLHFFLNDYSFTDVVTPFWDCTSTADLFSAGKNTYTGSYDRSKDSTGNAWCFVGQWYFTRYYNTHQSRAALIAALAWIMWLLFMQRWRHSVCIFVHRILFVHNPASSGYNLLLNRNTRDQICIRKKIPCWILL